LPLDSVLSDVVELYDATAEAEGITLVSEIEGGPVALGDRNLLTSAAANLLDNALKYAGSGATVSVRAIQDRDTVSIVVQDNGPGIPPAERSRVVDRFYRLDQSRSLPGIGLGLSIVTAIGLSAELPFGNAGQLSGNLSRRLPTVPFPPVPWKLSPPGGRRISAARRFGRPAPSGDNRSAGGQFTTSGGRNRRPARARTRAGVGGRENGLCALRNHGIRARQDNPG
jgi:hypothetical protein